MSRGYTRRADVLRAQARYIARGDTALGMAPIIRLVDGGWAIRRVLPWAAVATIPMPERRPGLVEVIGPRGRVLSSTGEG